MLRTRIIPALLLDDGALVKTRGFTRKRYVGDPCNTLRIFNELQVDELAVLDISATPQGREPDWRLLRDIASECFMPLSYGGGITGLEHARRLFDTGFEKVVLNSKTYDEPEVVTRIASIYGSQAVVASIDVAKGWFGREKLVSRSAKRSHRMLPEEWARHLEERGAGEILLTSVSREGSWEGYDINLIRRVSDAVDIPVVAQGGAGSVNDLVAAVRDGGASSVALGSMVVFQKKDFGVLVNFPEHETLRSAFSEVEERASELRLGKPE